MAFYEDKMARPRERARGFVIVAVEQARALTSPAYDLGRAAAELALARTDGLEAPRRHLVLSAKLVCRGSIRAPAPVPA